MKPYVDFNGKAKWANFWGDKVKKKIKKIFKKSARRQSSCNKYTFLDNN